MKHNRVVIAISIIGLAALIFMLNNTSPTEIGPFGVLLFFTTLYVVCFGIMTFLLQTFSKIAFSRTATRGKDYLYSAIAAFAPIMLMMACSFGAVNLWTISLIGVFIILAEFLVYKKYKCVKISIWTMVSKGNLLQVNLLTTFFTSGAGTNQANANTVDSKNNLDLNSKGAANWNQPIERNLKEIGGNVMVSSQEQLPPSAETENTELGKIINLEMPPGHEEPTVGLAEKPKATSDGTPADIAAELRAFRAENDHISRAALETTKKTIHDFETGKITPAELNDERWKFVTAYLDENYGLKVGEA